MELKRLYENRFHNESQERNSLWKVLCKNFFQHFISEDDIVLDIAAGGCEFINNIKAKKKYAFDLNPAINDLANQDVEAVNCSCFNMREYLKDNLIDTVFVSNFFEHLNSKDDVVNVLKLCNEILSENGKVIILQPNIKYVKGAYWDFIDHKLALTDVSLIEAGEMNGFKVKKVIKKFLPYTTKSKLPKADWLVFLYLKLMPFSGFFFGSQSLIILEK